MSDYDGYVTSFFASVTSPWPENAPEDDVIASNESTEGSELTDAKRGVSLIDDYMWMYFSPIVLILGLCGNILTVVVMRRKRLRGTTTSVYMPVMAVFDTVALCYGIAPEWFKAVDVVEFREVHPFLCKQEKFVFYTASDAAIWVLVLFTVDRFVAVSFPLQKSRVCVPRRSKVACLVVFLLCVAKNLHVFWTRGAEYVAHGALSQLITNCGKPEQYRHFESRHRPWMALALISVLPFCILLFCNSVIIWKLAQSGHRQVQMRKPDSSSSAQTMTLERSKTFKQTTMMCLSASFVFLVCVIPSIVMLIWKQYWNGSDSDSYEVAKAVNNQLAYLNHSINFFMYCLTGQKFRSELVSMMVQVRRSIRHSDADGLSTSRTTVTSVKVRNAVHSAAKGEVRV